MAVYKKDIVKRIHTTLDRNLSAKAIDDVLTSFFKVVNDATLIDGQSVRLKGFGTFSKRDIKGRTAHAFGKTYVSTPKKKVAFKGSKKPNLL